MNTQMVLNMKGLGCGIESLDVKPHFAGGRQMIITLDNGFGLSVLVGGEGLYTKGGTFEVAVLDANSNLIDPFDNGDTVYGYLSHGQVAELILKVSHLKAEGHTCGADCRQCASIARMNKYLERAK